MTLTDCQLLSIVAQLGTFAAAAERLHITPSAVSHAVSGVEAECGFPLFTRAKSGVRLTANAEKLMPELMFKEGAASAGCQVLQLEPAAKRSIGLACLSRTALSPAAREFVNHARKFARER